MDERERQGLPIDPEMEARLRSARPRPDPSLVARLEEELFDARALRRSPRRSWRPVFVGGFAVAGLAALTIAFDIAGIGPFSSSGNGPAQARDKCHTVVVTKRELQPLTRKGHPGTVFAYRNVKRHVTRCH